VHRPRNTRNVFHHAGVRRGNQQHFLSFRCAARRRRLCSPKAHIASAIAHVCNVRNGLAEASEKPTSPLGLKPRGPRHACSGRRARGSLARAPGRTCRSRAETHRAQAAPTSVQRPAPDHRLIPHGSHGALAPVEEVRARRTEDSRLGYVRRESGRVRLHRRSRYSILTK